jgi:hypothetical protein
MLHTNYAVHPNRCSDSFWRRIVALSINDWRVSAYSLVIVSVCLIIISSMAHGDEMGGQSQDDTKDMISYTRSGSDPLPPTGEPSVTSSAPLFLPMPTWAHGASLPALPYQLTPMGKKPVVVAASASAPVPEPLEPPKDTASTAPPPEPKETAPKPVPAPEAPALIAVSPFLQWIKSNPKAADEAREEASHPTAQTPTGPTTGANVITAGPNGNTNAPDPYWLPPLIDSAEFSAGPVGGSAAIYSTPQR